MDNNNLGERIRKILDDKKMTQKELSKKTDITEAAISHYIKGDRTPRSTVLGKIALALNTTPEYLLEGIPNGAKEELGYARKLIARNVHQMTREEKMDFINLLIGDGNND